MLTDVIYFGFEKGLDGVPVAKITEAWNVWKPFIMDPSFSFKSII